MISKTFFLKRRVWFIQMWWYYSCHKNICSKMPLKEVDMLKWPWECEARVIHSDEVFLQEGFSCRYNTSHYQDQRLVEGKVWLEQVMALTSYMNIWQERGGQILGCADIFFRVRRILESCGNWSTCNIILIWNHRLQFFIFIVFWQYAWLIIGNS